LYNQDLALDLPPPEEKERRSLLIRTEDYVDQGDENDDFLYEQPQVMAVSRTPNWRALVEKDLQGRYFERMRKSSNAENEEENNGPNGQGSSPNSKPEMYNTLRGAHFGRMRRTGKSFVDKINEALRNEKRQKETARARLLEHFGRMRKNGKDFVDKINEALRNEKRQKETTRARLLDHFGRMRRDRPPRLEDLHFGRMRRSGDEEKRLNRVLLSGHFGRMRRTPEMTLAEDDLTPPDGKRLTRVLQVTQEATLLNCFWIFTFKYVPLPYTYTVCFLPFKSGSTLWQDVKEEATIDRGCPVTIDSSSFVFVGEQFELEGIYTISQRSRKKDLCYHFYFNVRTTYVVNESVDASVIGGRGEDMHAYHHYLCCSRRLRYTTFCMRETSSLARAREEAENGDAPSPSPDRAGEDASEATAAKRVELRCSVCNTRSIIASSPSLLLG